MKNLFRRMSIPTYAANTVRIKVKRLWYTFINSNSPYRKLRKHVSVEKSSTHQLTFTPFYDCFGYMDFEKAKEYYKDNNDIVPQIMLALFESNQMIVTDKIDINRLKGLAQTLFDKGTIEKKGLYFYTNTVYKKFDLHGDHYSGITQAKAASFFLRCYYFNREEIYLNWAKMSLVACQRKYEDGGILRTIDQNIWVEEYQSPTPSMVLNGYIFVIIALGEYNTFENQTLNDFYTQSMSSLLSWLPHYYYGNDILYSTYRWSFCNIHYLGILQYQFYHLYKLTQLEIFNSQAIRMEKIGNEKLFKAMLCN
ncbi:MAG: D-glucuronyl C5-epimerase family protein [Saprospiraceae bacterium]